MVSPLRKFGLLQLYRWLMLPKTLEHHFSIAYGRPPIIHEDPSITQHNFFTQSPSVSQGDLRLHSQVDLFIILTRIYLAFGPDVDLEVQESDFPKIDQFDADLGDWQSAWLPRLGELQASKKFILTFVC